MKDGWKARSPARMQEVKKAREAFQPKFKKKEDLLCNPVLGEAFYLRLKETKRSTASKSNIDTKQKEYRNAVNELYAIDLANLENNPQWFRNNVLNRPLML